MQRDHRRAGVLAHASDAAPGSRISSFQPLRILAVTGKMRARTNAPDDVGDEREIAEAAGAAVALHDLLHRAAEIDVDEVGCEHIGDECGGIAHRDRIGAEDLHADRVLLGAEAQLGERRFVLAADALGRKEFGDDHVRAEAAAKPAEGRLRHPRHGREVEWNRGRQRDREAHP